jgi:hypothetical protein
MEPKHLSAAFSFDYFTYSDSTLPPEVQKLSYDVYDHKGLIIAVQVSGAFFIPLFK